MNNKTSRMFYSLAYLIAYGPKFCRDRPTEYNLGIMEMYNFQ